MPILRVTEINDNRLFYLGSIPIFDIEEHILKVEISMLKSIRTFHLKWS